MIIDILVLVAILSAVWKGYQKGLLMALFNTLSLIIGLAAAVKLSVVVSPWLTSELNISSGYVPFLSFALVLLTVVIIIRFAANMVQKSLESIKIGFLNRLGGIALYLGLQLALVSIMVYYMDKVGIISPEIKAQSVTASYILPWGPFVLDTIGVIIPFFKDMFGELNDFFDQIAGEAGKANT